MSILVILPHQLFDMSLLPYECNRIILWEHPHYFTSYNYNKKKLILHRASMRYYYKLLISNGYKVKYVQYFEKLNEKFNDKYVMFDPIDKIKLPGKIRLIESPNFLLTKDDYIEYRKKSQRFFFNAFYMWGKKVINVIPNIKSQDRMNRKRKPQSLNVPKIPSNQNDIVYIKEAQKYVEKHFPKNCGNTENFIFPVTHDTAKKWLTHFTRYRFKNFGFYEDFIDKNNPILFHSCLSSSINIGLLNPLGIIGVIKKYQKTIPLSCYEGYIRQLFWREYQRFTYIHFDEFNKNFFGNKKKLTKEWYNGTTGIDPVDDCIKEAFNIGYLHHIKRLMVTGNFMNISGISPKEGFIWMMEFSCDSYEWVMHQNVLEMVFFVSGGKTMTRPYISSSNYILKMSNYSPGAWSEKWNALYNAFIKKHKKKLWRYRYFFPGLWHRA